jgi:hypothetical protein
VSVKATASGGGTEGIQKVCEGQLRGGKAHSVVVSLVSPSSRFQRPSRHFISSGKAISTMHVQAVALPMIAPLDPIVRQTVRIQGVAGLRSPPRFDLPV